MAPARRSHTGTVLIVFPWCLDRLGHGNIQRVLSMSRYLAQQGFAVDLVYQGNSGVAPCNHQLTGFRRILRVETRRSRDHTRIAREQSRFYAGLDRPAASLTPGTAITRAVRNLLEQIDYTAVISSYAWTAPIFEPLEHRALRIVDLHDIISLHSVRSQAATGSVSPYSLSERTEAFLWRKWDVLLAITPEEANIVASTLRVTQRLLTIPHAAHIPASTKGNETVVVYTASDNASNQHALKWLLTDVWPRVCLARPDANLRVVGLVCDIVRSTPLAYAPNVDLVGFVADLGSELAHAGICVAPYLYGTGLKIKIIDAAAAGRAIVTTSAGIEGTGMRPGEHVLVADDPDIFAGAILRLLDDKELRTRLAETAREFVRHAFSEDACYGPLVGVLRAHIEARSRPDVPNSTEERPLRFRIARSLEALASKWMG
jgi:Glycosyl transferases group 1